MNEKKYMQIWEVYHTSWEGWNQSPARVMENLFTRIIWVTLEKSTLENYRLEDNRKHIKSAQTAKGL